MNKTAVKNFAIWARNKLIAEITYRAGLMGITESGIKNALPQSGNGTEYYDIGTKEPYAITGKQIAQRKDFVDALRHAEAGSDYQTAYRTIIDETAYTWFNRLIAVRFMEVNDYLPSKIRVLSSVTGKLEPDIVTTPFDAMMEYTEAERQEILSLKNEEKADEVFRYLFLKQCNELNKALPVLFEKVSDYTELLLAISFTDKEGIVYHLVHDISEEDFNVEIGGQVEIIGWMYQYYNTEPKAKVFGRASGTKIKKEDIPAATQLFTPDWIVRYMVENSLGRLWVERNMAQEDHDIGHWEDNNRLKSEWKYYLDEAKQEPEVEAQLAEIRAGYASLQPEDLLCIDPCMGSGHILCYFFDVLMQIYESQGYTQRDAAQSILEHNIYGLDIDERAYQLSYFAVMMKARQYDRRILTRGIRPHVHAIVESNSLNRSHLEKFGSGLGVIEKNNALNQIDGLIDALHDAKEYGSILSVDDYDWDLLRQFAGEYTLSGQMTLDEIGIEETQKGLQELICVGEALAQKYHVVVTNPPYMAVSNADVKVQKFVKENYPDSKADMFAVFIERCGKMIKNHGYQAMITQHGWMFLTSFNKIRLETLKKDIVNMAHLGARAFDEIGGEVVQTSSFVLRKSRIHGYKGQYRRLIDGDSEKKKEDIFLNGSNQYFSCQDNYAEIDGSPIAYWISKNLLKAFAEGTKLGELAFPCQGMATTNNDRFLKLWFEVAYDDIKFDAVSEDDTVNSKFFPYNKGGEYRKWYGNNSYVIFFRNKGKDVCDYIDSHSSVNHKGRVINRDKYFKENFTWGALAANLSCRYSPKGFIFDTKGSSCFAYDKDKLLYYLGFMNTNVSTAILELLAPTLDFNCGTLSKTPILFAHDKEDYICKLVGDTVRLSMSDWDAFETSWDFQQHPLVRCRSFSPEEVAHDAQFNIRDMNYIREAFTNWSNECYVRFDQLKANEEELNRIFINIYGLQDELTPEVQDKDITVRKADIQRDVKSLISYAVGCMFGRYSHYADGLLYAGGHWDYGTIVECISESAKSSGEGNWNPSALFLPDRDAVIPITDEEYFEDDIVGLFCNWLKKVYGEKTLEENLDFIAQALGNKGNSSREVIRNYFLKDFFKDHCDTYSVTGSGKRPIYWLYSSGNQNGFKALVYMHRYDADTTGRVRADYLHRMERVYDSEIGRMDEVIENSDNNREIANATRRKEKLQKQLKECRDYDERIAPLALSRIEIDLDDGVKVNYRKVQTDKRGKFQEILADSKTIMSKVK